MQVSADSSFWLLIGSVVGRFCRGLRGNGEDRLGPVRVGLATSSGCGQERIPRNPGHSKDQVRAFQGHCGSDLSGSRTSDAQRLSEVERDVTVLVIPRGLEDQDLTYVYSGSEDRFRSACYGRPVS